LIEQIELTVSAIKHFNKKDVYAYNPSYSEGSDKEDQGLRPVQAKS
jgi:hypothetical protein